MPILQALVRLHGRHLSVDGRRRGGECGQAGRWIVGRQIGRGEGFWVYFLHQTCLCHPLLQCEQNTSIANAVNQQRVSVANQHDDTTPLSCFFVPPRMKIASQLGTCTSALTYVQAVVVHRGHGKGQARRRSPWLGRGQSRPESWPGRQRQRLVRAPRPVCFPLHCNHALHLCPLALTFAPQV